MTKNVRVNFQIDELYATFLIAISDITGVPISELLRRAFTWYVWRNLSKNSKAIRHAFKIYLYKRSLQIKGEKNAKHRKKL